MLLLLPTAREGRLCGNGCPLAFDESGLWRSCSFHTGCAAVCDGNKTGASNDDETGGFAVALNRRQQRGSYAPATRLGRALALRERIENVIAASRWSGPRPTETPFRQAELFPSF